MWLQEAVLYLGRPRGAQQSVSLAGLVWPVFFLWKGVSRVLRHGVSLHFQSERAEGRETEHTYESRKDTNSHSSLFWSIQTN